METKTKQIVAFLIVLILIINLLLFATKRINETFFWAIIIIAAIFAYKIISGKKE